jgi:hypothetical protein
MNSRARTFLVLGLLLILGGAWMIALVNNPDLKAWWDSVVSWPILVVAAGFGLLLLGLLLNVPDMVIGASVVAGISLIMYAIFASIFVPLFGGPSLLGPYGPAGLFILAGLYVIIRGVLAARRRKELANVES